jgi:hypothetical protein
VCVDESMERVIWGVIGRISNAVDGAGGGCEAGRRETASHQTRWLAWPPAARDGSSREPQGFGLESSHSKFEAITCEKNMEISPLPLLVGF